KMRKTKTMTEPINENISQMNLVQTNGYPDKTQELQSEIQHRFGILPNMFRLPGENAEITAGMWNFAQFAYLDVPLPSLFKERLFVYLSRFSGERYCITRHIGFLTGLGHPSGDHNTPPQPIQHVIKLLQHPLPRQEKLDSIVEKLNALQSQL